MVGVFISDKKTLTIGRNASCDISFNLLEVSSVHIKIEMLGNEAMLYMTGRNGGYVNGRFIGYNESVSLKYADEIKILDISIIWFEKLLAVDSGQTSMRSSLIKAGASSCLPDKKNREINKSQADLFFSKAPRTFYKIDTEAVELDAPPQKHDEDRQPLFMMIMPALMMSVPMMIGFLIARITSKNSGSSIFMYTGVVTAVTSALLGIIMAVTNARNRRNQLLVTESKRQIAYKEYVDNCEAIIREKYNKNASSLRMMYPDISEYIKDGNRSFMLWARETCDDDFLRIRLGTGDIPCDINVTIPKEHFSVTEDILRTLPKRLKSSYSLLKDVPITVDLRENKVAAIVSDWRLYRDEAFLTLIMGLAVAVSPNELRFILKVGEKSISNEALRAIRFLPHVTLVSNVSKLQEEDSKDICTVLFTDNYDTDSINLESINNLYTIVVADCFDNIPSLTTLIIQRERHFSGYLNIKKESTERRIVNFDMITAEEAEVVSRELQKIRVRGQIKKYKLPDVISYYELFDTKLTRDVIISNWRNNVTSEKILAPIGVFESGEMFELNLHENAMGPHGLIAGMTGSGKSEILQTLILSLCVNYSPEEVGFFLIDYKGGGMSKLFEGLPHIMGSISNLSGRMIIRAMLSVKSENERRQRLFNKIAVNNISAYQRMHRDGKVKEPLPHVFIIIDEFAELKKEEPEFMKELVSVARVGRSLGIHLILATQKPAGVVDDNILSNSRFRICLRVQDRMDSMEMIKQPDAANITNPGRGIIQVGNDEIYAQFQGAYTMDRAPNVQRKKRLIIINQEGAEYKRKNDEIINDGSEPQLMLTVNEIKMAEEHIVVSRGSPLWLEPLKKEIFMKDRICYTDSMNTNLKRFEVSIGIYDDPSHQNQGEFLINFESSGHLIILGGLQSGKSTLLSVISRSIISNFHKDFYNIYFVDFSNGILKPYLNSNMSCGYISEDNEEDVQKLIILLKEIIASRKARLSGGNYWQYIEKKKVEDEDYLPPIVVFIDGLGGFRERTSGMFDRDLEAILKTSESLGIIIIASAINMSSHEVPKRIFDCFKTCIPLSLKDRYEYKDSLNGVSADFILPEEVPGRGLTKIDGRIVEFQTYQTIDAISDFNRNEMISKEVSQINNMMTGLRSEEISFLREQLPLIPKNLTITSFYNELARRGKTIDKGFPVGFFLDSGKVFSIPYKDDLFIVISGRPGSGKRNLLRVLMSAADKKKINYVNQEGVYSFDNGMKVIIFDENLSIDNKNEIKKMAGCDPYVIHMGGAIDRQNYFDFSYMPYMQQSKITKPGVGVVRKTNKGFDSGEVIIPEYV